MNPVVHFEMPYKNAERISGFYENVFGWKLQYLGSDFGDYVIATTAETDAKPGELAGTINGGFFPYKPDWPMQYPSIVIGVGDINETIVKIMDNDGEVLGKPHLIPGFGLYVSFVDTEGNRNSIIEPRGM